MAICQKFSRGSTEVFAWYNYWAHYGGLEPDGPKRHWTLCGTKPCIWWANRLGCCRYDGVIQRGEIESMRWTQLKSLNIRRHAGIEWYADQLRRVRRARGCSLISVHQIQCWLIWFAYLRCVLRVVCRSHSLPIDLKWSDAIFHNVV